MSAIHHLEPAEKQALYAKCHAALAPNGLFLNGDEFRPESDADYLAMLKWWSQQKDVDTSEGRIPESFRPVFEAWHERNITRFGEPKSSGDDCHETATVQEEYLRRPVSATSTSPGVNGCGASCSVGADCHAPKSIAADSAADANIPAALQARSSACPLSAMSCSDLAMRRARLRLLRFVDPAQVFSLVRRSKLRTCASQLAGRPARPRNLSASRAAYFARPSSSDSSAKQSRTIKRSRLKQRFQQSARG